MIVLTLSRCAPGLKGDVTKWLLEVNTGVYVGKTSARVRDLLWKRVCEHCGTGEATMVFSSRNEQGFSFYVHNTKWKPTDFDGIILPKKPLPPKKTNVKHNATLPSDGRNTNCTQLPTLKHKHGQKKPKDITSCITNREITCPLNFVAIDLETTGLKSDSDNIIELAAVRYKQGKPVGQYHSLVKCEGNIPENIVRLTGIKNELLKKYGQTLEKSIKELLEFIEDDILVGHYISFDMGFLRQTCCYLNIPFKQYQVIDTVIMARELYKESVENYRLLTLTTKLGISDYQEHRALPDAVLAAKLYMKLNEFI